VKILCDAATHVGRVRSSNEDYYATSSLASGELSSEWRGEIDTDGGWILVADGMGGHAAGEVASELAVECMRTLMPQIKSKEDVPPALEATNLALFDAMDRNSALAGMGTTIAGAIFFGEKALLFNVGDSRIYSFTEGALRQLSQDHVVMGHVLTQCLGGSGRVRCLQPCRVEVELAQVGQLLLCTDGLTDMLDDSQIGEILEQRGCASRLIAAALAAGGVDNVTAAIVQVS
jgi:protein phosphatase